MAKPSAFKKQAGETIDIVYLPDKPALFAAYLPEARVISAQSKIVK